VTVTAIDYLLPAGMFLAAAVMFVLAVCMEIYEE